MDKARVAILRKALSGYHSAYVSIGKEEATELLQSGFVVNGRATALGTMSHLRQFLDENAAMRPAFKQSAYFAWTRNSFKSVPELRGKLEEFIAFVKAEIVDLAIFGSSKLVELLFVAEVLLSALTRERNMALILNDANAPSWPVRLDKKSMISWNTQYEPRARTIVPIRRGLSPETLTDGDAYALNEFIVQWSKALDAEEADTLNGLFIRWEENAFTTFSEICNCIPRSRYSLESVAKVVSCCISMGIKVYDDSTQPFDDGVIDEEVTDLHQLAKERHMVWLSSKAGGQKFMREIGSAIRKHASAGKFSLEIVVIGREASIGGGTLMKVPFCMSGLVLVLREALRRSGYAASWDVDSDAIVITWPRMATNRQKRVGSTTHS